MGGRGRRECGSRKEEEEIPLHMNHHCTCHKAEVQKTAYLTPIYVCFDISDKLSDTRFQYIHTSDVLHERRTSIHPI